MKLSQESSSAVIDKKKSIDNAYKQEYADKQDDNDESLENSKIAEIDKAIEECRTLYKNPLLSEKTRNEYEKMWAELRAQKNVEWMQDNVGFLLATLSKAESYRNTFRNIIDEAVNKKWINEESRTKWWNRFNDPNILEWTRNEWLKTELPDMRDRWKDAAEKREDIIELAKKSGVNDKDIPELANILNQEAFLSLHYLSRKDQMAQAESLILAHIEGKTKFIKFIQAELKDWAHEGIMHSSKIGEWMARVIKSKNPEEFASKVLYPFKDNWKEVKENFDKLNAALDKQGIPRGFRPVKNNNFLLMDYKQRTSYCALAWLRLENAEEEDKELAGLKLRIRHNLDMQDWEGAEDDLKMAMNIKPNDRELASMRTYMQCHNKEDTPESVETPDPNAILANMRNILGQIEGDAHDVYAWALKKGENEADTLFKLMSNLVWTHENNYSSEAEDIKRGDDEENKNNTRDFVEHGHSKKIEFNILQGDTATPNAVRDECTKAQMLYVASDGKGALKTAIEENAKNEDVKYWTSVKFKTLPFSLHNQYVKNFNYPLKKGLRDLKKMGYGFTLTGELERLDMASAQKPKEAKIMPRYEMAA